MPVLDCTGLPGSPGKISETQAGQCSLKRAFGATELFRELFLAIKWITHLPWFYAPFDWLQGLLDPELVQDRRDPLLVPPAAVRDHLVGRRELLPAVRTRLVAGLVERQVRIHPVARPVG